MTTSEPQKARAAEARLGSSRQLCQQPDSTSRQDCQTPRRLPAWRTNFSTALPVSESALPAIPGAVPGSLPGPFPATSGASDLPSRFASPSPHDLPSETRIHSALAALPQNIQPQVPAIPGALMSPPAIPGSPDLARFSDPTSAFAFLDEARPLFGFAGLTSAATPNLDTIKIPTDTDFRSLADEFSTTPPPRVSDAQIPQTAPQIPGAPIAANPVRILPRLQLPQRNPPARLDSIHRTNHILTGGAEPDRPLLTQPPRRLLRRRFPPPRLPHPAGARQRQAPHLARQRRDHAKTASGHRPPQLLLRPRKFQHPPRRPRPRRTRHRRLRSRPRKGAPLPQRAVSTNEIIFVRGATEGINLIAQSWGRQNIHKGDEIVITWLEHHANIVPWQMLCAETGARLRVAPVDDSGQILLDEYRKAAQPQDAPGLVHSSFQRARHRHSRARA